MRTRILLIAAVVALVATPALAFHDSGVAHCNGCHTMHNSQDNAAMNDGPPLAPGKGYASLMLYPTATDTCLNCHYGSPGSYHVWSNAGPLVDPTESGAGNFVFLEEDNLYDGHGGGDGTCSVATCGPGNADPCTNEPSCLVESGGVWTWDDPTPGEAAGHTLVSGIAGIALPDQTLTTAPGGSYPAASLACTSCHDPHGTDSFRMTYKDGSSSDGATPVNWTATIKADGISVFASESNGFHNAYKDGYSEWCSTCHGDFHGGWTADLIHPSGQLMTGATIAKYNAYRGTADCITNPPVGVVPCGSGTSADAYLKEVPFQDDTLANNNFSTAGPSATGEVACVSCHRAHATSAPDAGRWDFSVTGLAEDGLESGSYPIPGPYGNTQRSLCNKCHTQDEFDAPHTF